MGKGVAGLIVGIVIAVAAIGAFFYLTGSSETVAYLNIESGNVQVNSGRGWQAATDQMNLKEDYSVKTLDDGQASIVFYESDIMELSPNTEVELARLVAEQINLNQKSGSTWNRVNKLTGTREYTVETPNSVATVRGTGFGVNVSDEGDEILVDGGVVECRLRNRQNLEEIREFQRCLVQNGQLIRGNVTRAQLLLMKARLETGVIILEKVQMREINKKRIVLNLMKKRYNLTDENVREHIKRANRGEYDLDEIQNRIRVRSQSITKIKRITLKIMELNDKIERIDKKLASMG